MIIALLLIGLLVSFGLWSYANEVKVQVEHHSAEVIQKREIPPAQEGMLYMYRHGYLSPGENLGGPPLPPTHEVQIQSHDPSLPGILNIQNTPLYHQVQPGEQVHLEVRKVITRHKITNQTKTKHLPVSILKSNGHKIPV